MLPEIKRDRLSFEYDVLCMHEVQAREFLGSESDDERILAVLCASDDPRATIRAILGSWRHLPAKELSEKIQDLQVLSQLRNRDTMVIEESSAMPIEIDITQNAMFKWGEEKGVAQGEGKQLIKFLENKFGPLSEAVRGRIAAADIARLDLWTDRSFRAATLDDVFAS